MWGQRKGSQYFRDLATKRKSWNDQWIPTGDFQVCFFKTRFSYLVYLIAMAFYTPGHFDIPFYQLSLVLQTTKQSAYWNDLGFEPPVPAESDSFDWGAADIEKALRSFLEAGGVLRWECRHGWWLKPLTTSNVGYRKPRVNPVKKCKGLDQLPGNYLSTGAGFQPSTVQLLDMSTECTVCECILIVYATWYLYLQVSHHEFNLLH